MVVRLLLLSGPLGLAALLAFAVLGGEPGGATLATAPIRLNKLDDKRTAPLPDRRELLASLSTLVARHRADNGIGDDPDVVYDDVAIPSTVDERLVETLIARYLDDARKHQGIDFADRSLDRYLRDVTLIRGRGRYDAYVLRTRTAFYDDRLLVFVYDARLDRVAEKPLEIAGRWFSPEASQVERRIVRFEDVDRDGNDELVVRQGTMESGSVGDESYEIGRDLGLIRLR